MQLEMSRSQRNGFFKTKYVLAARVVLTSEEQDLLKQHKLENTVLFDAEAEWGHPHIFVLIAGNITKGFDFHCNTVDELAILENRLEENCRMLAAQLKSLKGAFDGSSRTLSFDD
jgi:hypothetical protein